MRRITAHTRNAWTSRAKIGNKRPVARATIQAAQLQRIPYNTNMAPGGDYDHERGRDGIFTSILFTGDERIRELPGIRSVNWQRAVDQDVADCTVTILNSVAVAMGVDAGVDTFEHPGGLTPGRGPRATEEAAERWGFDQDIGWNDAIRPDRLLKTYEGYGSDPSVAPGDDPHMYMSGTWLIDEVQFAANGDLVITARDLGRLLLDHIVFPPVVPSSDYPLSFSTIRSEEVQGRVPTGGKWQIPRGSVHSSNDRYVGKGIQDSPRYVGPNGGWMGHRARDAVSGGGKTWWWSTGQERAQDYAWWQVDFNKPTAMAGFAMRARGGPYRAYISLHDGTRWLGKKEIDYEVTTEGVDLNADIPFVAAVPVDQLFREEWKLPRVYKGIRKMRITLTRLRPTAGSTKYPYRAALRHVEIYTGQPGSLGFGSGTLVKPVGNISDYSQMVIWACSWAGLFWPGAQHRNWIRYSQYGPKVPYRTGHRDRTLPHGRMWGSRQRTGTAPVADLTADMFDKQPLMEIVNNVRDLTGFLFYIDEVGGAIWRMPNLYKVGNWISRSHKEVRVRPERVTAVAEIPVIDERTTLMDYTAREASYNLRERVGVTDTMGKYGAVIRGYDPPGRSPKLRRAAIWSDTNFASNREARVAADLVAAQQMFDYRRGKVTIWGSPEIQIDDQIRIFERTTNETNFHYVASIQSSLDMEAGTWDYGIETHWLGSEPNESGWLITTQKLQKATRDYLALLNDPDDADGNAPNAQDPDGGDL